MYASIWYLKKEQMFNAYWVCTIHPTRFPKKDNKELVDIRVIIQLKINYEFSAAFLNIKTLNIDPTS